MIASPSSSSSWSLLSTNRTSRTCPLTLYEPDHVYSTLPQFPSRQSYTVSEPSESVSHCGLSLLSVVQPLSSRIWNWMLSPLPPSQLSVAANETE